MAIKTRTPTGRHCATALDIEIARDKLKNVQATLTTPQRRNKKRGARSVDREAVPRDIMREFAFSRGNVGISVAESTVRETAVQSGNVRYIPITGASDRSAVNSGFMRDSASPNGNVRFTVSEGTVRDKAVPSGKVRYIDVTGGTDQNPTDEIPAASPMVPGGYTGHDTCSPMVPAVTTPGIDRQHTPPAKKRMRSSPQLLQRCDPYTTPPVMVPETPPEGTPSSPRSGDSPVMIQETPSPDSQTPEKLCSRNSPVQDPHPETEESESPCGKFKVFTTYWGPRRRVVKVTAEQFWTQGFPNFVCATNIKGGQTLPNQTSDIFRKAINDVLPRHMHVSGMRAGAVECD